MNTSSAVDSLSALAQETRLNIFRLLVQNAPRAFLQARSHAVSSFPDRHCHFISTFWPRPSLSSPKGMADLSLTRRIFSEREPPDEIRKRFSAARAQRGWRLSRVNLEASSNRSNMVSSRLKRIDNLLVCCRGGLIPHAERNLSPVDPP